MLTHLINTTYQLTTLLLTFVQLISETSIFNSLVPDAWTFPDWSRDLGILFLITVRYQLFLLLDPRTYIVIQSLTSPLTHSHTLTHTLHQVLTFLLALVLFLIRNRKYYLR